MNMTTSVRQDKYSNNLDYCAFIEKSVKLVLVITCLRGKFGTNLPSSLF